MLDRSRFRLFITCGVLTASLSGLDQFTRWWHAHLRLLLDRKQKHARINFVDTERRQPSPRRPVSQPNAAFGRIYSPTILILSISGQRNFHCVWPSMFEGWHPVDLLSSDYKPLTVDKTPVEFG